MLIPRPGRTIGAGAILIAALGLAQAGSSEAAEPLYSVQVRAVPAAERADGLATYRALRDKGYTAYFYRARVNGDPWLRIAVGAFDSAEAAAAFGRDFSRRESMDHFVTRAPVRTMAYREGSDLLVMPSAVWLRRDGDTREIFVFADAEAGWLGEQRRIRDPLPNRAHDVVALHVDFQFGERIYLLDLEGGTPHVRFDSHLADIGLYGARPGWSPSGRHLGFMDFRDMEAKSSLWIVGADGTGLRPLVDNRPAASDRAVKDFVWHPVEDRALYVSGYAYGTMSPGGVVRSADLEGNDTVVLEPPGERQQIVGPLAVEGDRLGYRILQFDEDYMERTLVDASVPLAGL